MTESKISRESATREKAVRPRVWQPADRLPAPTPQEGWAFRWVRIAIMGKPDPTNMSRNLREGWELCRLEDHPELQMSVDATAATSGQVEVGGLVLCKIPAEMAAQRDAYYANNTNSQTQSVDSSFMKENDPRMPLFSEKKSQVSFGSGSR